LKEGGKEKKLRKEIIVNSGPQDSVSSRLSRPLIDMQSSERTKREEGTPGAAKT